MDLSALPADFRWGVATSAYQTEGAVDADGRLSSIWDDFCRTPDAIDGGDTGVEASDSYRRWPADLDLLQRLGVASYRFSIAWPRVQPHGTGAVNQPGLDHYDRMVNDLLEVGIQPFVTLYHWDLPSPLQHRGGWVARDTAYRFADYAGLVAQRLGDRVVDWSTINEPLCCAWIAHLEGTMAPGHRDLREAVHASHHLLLGHGLAAEAVRAQSAVKPSVGIVLNLSPCEPASPSPDDLHAAERADGHTNRWWLDPLHGRGYPNDMVEVYGIQPPVQPGDLEAIATPLDFVGVNYYFRMKVAADDTVATLGYRAVPVAGANTTAMGWEIHPNGLRDVLLRVTKEYEPQALYVTESGAAFVDVPDEQGYVRDDDRADYLRAHIEATAAASADGAPVRGFYSWSLIDNFEWAYGYRPRFGLAYVDYATQQRTIKYSGEAYARLVREFQKTPRRA
ncbi:MAG: beta-glucosidase [Pseudonocardiales bacterium]|jgi:beta-glucosidase|nr:beta-glucosidase [Pseudonocardiales bacterium]